MRLFPHVFVVACLVLSPPGRASAEESHAAAQPDGVLSETALRDLLAGEIKARLSRSARFTLLPNNISALHVSAGQAPIFVMSKGESYGRTPFSATLDSFSKDYGSFRLMIEGRVAGMSENGESVIVDGRGMEGAVMGPQGQMLRSTPGGMGIVRAFYVGGKWVYQTSAGLVEEGGSTAPEDTEEEIRGAIVSGVGEDLLIIRPNERSRTRENQPLTITLKTAKGSERRSFGNVPFRGIQGAVRLRNGDWLAIGEKLAILRDDDVPPPPEAEVRSGFQYFDGRWIARSRLLGQRQTDEAYLVMTFSDDPASAQRQGLFVVRPDGRLDLLSEFDESVAAAAGRSTVMTDGKGDAWIFMPRYGLARIAHRKLLWITRRKLHWVDRSDTMKSLDSLLGRDRNGRLYFSQSNVIPPEAGAAPQPLFWIFDPDGKPSKGAEMRLVPTTSLPIPDSLGRIWFVYDGRSGAGADEYESSGRSTYGFRESDATLMKQAKPRPLTWSGTNLHAAADHVAGPTLYCYADGQLYRCLTHPGLRSATLLAGADGALFVVPPRRSEPTLVIDDDVVVAGPDLHALAEEHFDLLMRTAPDRALPRGSPGLGIFAPRPSVSLCRAGGMLWINQNGRTEVYRNGKSLFMDKRLTLLSGRSERSGVLGPLEGKPTGMLLTTRSDSIQDIFWATANDEGIALERSAEPPSAWPGGGTLTAPGRLESAPLLDRTAGRVYCYNGYDRVWEATGPRAYTPLPGAGAPVLAIRDSRLLVYRHAQTYRGYRIVTAAAQYDVKPTYVRQLRVLNEEQDGRLMCAGPEGIAWLRPGEGGEYVLDEDLPGNAGVQLCGYLSSGGGEIRFLAVGANGRLYIAVWSRP